MNETQIKDLIKEGSKFTTTDFQGYLMGLVSNGTIIGEEEDYILSEV